MTDNEIIKALECCKAGRCISGECAFYSESKGVEECMDELVNHSFDLINRQKAEISKLQSDQYAIDKFARDLCKERMLKGKAIADFEDLQDYIKKEKTEAIREFAELVKENHDRIFNVIYSERYFRLRIDELVEEMTEGGNG